MSDKTMESRTEQVVGTIEKKKRGRKPMTGEGKDAMAKARAAKKELADNLKPELFIQFQGDQTDLNTLLEQAKADFHAEKKRTLITVSNAFNCGKDGDLGVVGGAGGAGVSVRVSVTHNT